LNTAGGRVAVAVSGGRDSTVLLHATLRAHLQAVTERVIAQARSSAFHSTAFLSGRTSSREASRRIASGDSPSASACAQVSTRAACSFLRSRAVSAARSVSGGAGR
jgi:diphthamide synthase (EF-2-diphthine--ammonia ligase)